MTEQELEELIQANSERIAGMSQPEQPLSKQEKNLKHMLRLQGDALERIKAAKAKGDMQNEIKAGIDYAVYKEYENRHPLLVFLVKARMRWYGI
jgi:hypothetical protein